jgi:hypothetical protein
VEKGVAATGIEIEMRITESERPFLAGEMVYGFLLRVASHAGA